MNTYALLMKINEETKLHEKRLHKAMTEENENLRESIKKIKQNMERTLFYKDIPHNNINNGSSHLKTTSNVNNNNKHINIYKCLSPLSIGVHHHNNLFLSPNTKRTYKVDKEYLRTKTENDIKQARQQYLIRVNKQKQNEKWKNVQESNTVVRYKKRKRICLSNDFDNDNSSKVAHLGSARQFLNGIVNRVVDRSLFIYNNKNCHSCTKSLSKGKSTENCPKCH